MRYPCIRYSLAGDEAKFADNRLYSHLKRYEVTVIDHDPDSSLPDLVGALPYCRLDRWYAADDLNHWVYILFF